MALMMLQASFHSSREPPQATSSHRDPAANLPQFRRQIQLGEYALAQCIYLHLGSLELGARNLQLVPHELQTLPALYSTEVCVHLPAQSLLILRAEDNMEYVAEDGLGMVWVWKKGWGMVMCFGILLEGVAAAALAG
ncbi:uncharacterized protein [Drosophila kikkawai]|uniref:Uncharacterized protein n=1 Tax=Drosophila kikkawai TaxID=30033 RepID=A0ABM4GGF4_DROKI